MREAERWFTSPRSLFLVMVFVCIVATGLAVKIPLGYLPRSLDNSVMVEVEHRGAFEREIERTIVEPLEGALAQLPGIVEVFSVAERDRARIVVGFSDSTELDTAFLAVREAVYATSLDFPEDVQRPLIVKSDPRSRPVFIASMPASLGMRERQLKRLYETAEGCGEVEISGGIRPHVHIRYDPQVLADSGVSLEQLLHRVRGINVVGGFATESGSPHLVDTRFRRIADMECLTIREGIRLADLACIEVAERAGESGARVNGQSSLLIHVRPAGDANILVLCRNLDRIASSLPQTRVLYNRGLLIERALMRVLLSALIGMVSVVLLTVLFTGRLVPAALISADIPFSVIITLALLQITGEQLNVLSLSGIAVGMGLVIDAGVVFLEEFTNSGCDRGNAIARAKAPILVSTATTIAVFLPLLFAPRPLVEQFRGLALAVSGSLACSCVYVFVFLPVLLQGTCAKKPLGTAARPGIRRSGWDLALRHVLTVLNRFRIPIGIAGVAVLGAVVYLAIGFDRQGISEGGLDERMLHFSAEYPDGYTTEAVWSSASILEGKLLSDAGVQQVCAAYEPERARFFVQLSNGTRMDTWIHALMRISNRIEPGFLYFPDGSPGRTSLSVVLSGADVGRLEQLASRMSTVFHDIPQCRGILLHFKKVSPARELCIDLAAAAQGGTTARSLLHQIYWALSSPVLDKWTSSGREMDIRMGAAPAATESLKAVMQLPRIGSGAPVGSFIALGERSRSGTICRLDRSRIVRLSVLCDWRYRRQVLDAIQRELTKFPLPPGYRAEVAREALEKQALARALYGCLALAVLLVFFILMFHFESAGICAVIMLQIPIAFIGPILLLEVLSWPLSFPVGIGLILTAGIAVNNAVLVLGDLGGAGFSLMEVHRALSGRMRPILVSSLTTISGVAPLLFTGASSSSVLAPLSITVAVGIACSIPGLILGLALFGGKDTERTAAAR